MIGRAATRVVIVALAAVTLAWLGHDLRAVSLDAQGEAQARAAHSARQVDRALSLFARAAHGNADPGPRINEAKFLLSLGRTNQAVNVLNAVVRTNPGNLIAWSLLESATAGTDPTREAQANEQLFLLFGHPAVYYVSAKLIFSPTGTDYVVPGQVQGLVEGVRISGHVAQFVGWSAVVTKKPGNGYSVLPAQDILILANGRFIAGATPTVSRPDVARNYHVPVARAGFTLDVPVAQLETGGRKDHVQVFASSPGVASPLPVRCRPQPQAFGCSG